MQRVLVEAVEGNSWHKEVLLGSQFTEEETKVLRARVTCPKAFSWDFNKKGPIPVIFNCLGDSFKEQLLGIFFYVAPSSLIACFVYYSKGF